MDEWKWTATSAETRSMTSGRRTLTRGFFALFAASLIGGGYKRESGRDQLIFRVKHPWPPGCPRKRALASRGVLEKLGFGRQVKR